MIRWKPTQEKADEKMDKFDRKMEHYSKKTDEKKDTFLQTITDTVGKQLDGMNSTIAKMKEEDDRYNQISERIMNMEKKILDIDEEHRETRIKVKAVVTRSRSEASESEVVKLLQEMITEKGMSLEETNTSEKRTCLKKELRGRVFKITPSVDAEERFHQKRMEYVKYCIHVKHNIPLD